MNKITNFYNRNVNFSASNKEKKVLSNEEKFNKLYSDCKNIFISNIEKNNFDSVPFEIAGTPYIAVFKIKNHENEKIFSLGVRHQNRDDIGSYNMFTGSKQDIIDYLSDEKNDAEIKKSINELRQKQEEYYSSL